MILCNISLKRFRADSCIDEEARHSVYRREGGTKGGIHVDEHVVLTVQDPAEGMKIVDILLRYEDEHQSWPSGRDAKPSRGFELLSQVRQLSFSIFQQENVRLCITVPGLVQRFLTC